MRVNVRIFLSIIFLFFNIICSFVNKLYNMKKWISLVFMLCFVFFFAQEENVLQNAILFKTDNYQYLEYNGILISKTTINGNIEKSDYKKLLKRNKVYCNCNKFEYNDLYKSNDSIAAQLISDRKNISDSVISQTKVYLKQITPKTIRLITSTAYIPITKFDSLEQQYIKAFRAFLVFTPRGFIVYNSQLKRLELGNTFEDLKNKNITETKTDELFFVNEKGSYVSIHWSKFSDVALAKNYIYNYLNYKMLHSDSAKKTKALSKMNFFGKPRSVYLFLPNGLPENNSYDAHTSQLILVEEANEVFVLSIINHFSAKY